jgi:hypothetical protein
MSSVVCNLGPEDTLMAGVRSPNLSKQNSNPIQKDIAKGFSMAYNT